MAKYLEIAETLREKIQNGTYPKGSLLPNQVDLVQEFQVSRMTIKKAVDLLISEGLLYAKPGFGTRILAHALPSKEMVPVDEYLGLTQQLKKSQKKITSQVLTFKKIAATPFLQEKLMLENGSLVYEITRLRLLDDRPYVLEYSYMPVSLLPHLSAKILKKSIYHYAMETLGLKIAGAYRTLSAAKTTPDDENYLHCQKDDPVLEVEQVVFLENGQPLDYSRARNRYDVRGYSMLDIHGAQH